jgi:hypothetical protein
MPTIMEFDNSQKGKALYAMELALSLEKLTNQKLLNASTCPSGEGQTRNLLGFACVGSNPVVDALSDISAVRIRALPNSL